MDFVRYDEQQGFSKGAVRALKIIMQIRQEKAKLLGKPAVVPAPLLKLAPKDRLPKKKEVGQYDFNAGDIIRCMKEESVSIQEVMEASQKRIQNVDTIKRRNLTTAEQIKQAGENFRGNPSVDLVVGSVERQSDQALAKHLSPKSKGVLLKQTVSQRQSKNDCSVRFNLATSPDLPRSISEIGTQLHQFLLNEAHKAKLTSSDNNDENQAYFERLNIMLQHELLQEQKNKQLMNSKTETAAQHHQLPKIFGTPQLQETNAVAEENLPTKFIELVNTKKELGSPKKSSRHKAASFGKHRPSLEEVLKQSSRPIKYHPGIDADSDNEDPHPYGASEVDLDQDLKDHQIAAERLFRDQQRITSTAAYELMHDVQAAGQKVNVKSLLASTFNISSLRKRHESLYADIKQDFNKTPNIADVIQKKGEVAIESQDTHFTSRTPQSRYKPPMKKSKLDLETVPQVPKLIPGASFLSHISPIRQNSKLIQDRMLFFDEQKSTTAILHEEERVRKVSLKQPVASYDFKQCLLNVDSRFLTDPQAYQTANLTHQTRQTMTMDEAIKVTQLSTAQTYTTDGSGRNFTVASELRRQLKSNRTSNTVSPLGYMGNSRKTSERETSTPRPVPSISSQHVVTALGTSEYQQQPPDLDAGEQTIVICQQLEKPQIPSMTVVHSRSSDPGENLTNYVVPDTAPHYPDKQNNPESSVHTHPLGWERQLDSQGYSDYSGNTKQQLPPSRDPILVKKTSMQQVETFLDNNSDLAKDLGRLDSGGNRSQMGGTASPMRIKNEKQPVPKPLPLSALPVNQLPTTTALMQKKDTPTSQQLSFLQSDYIKEHNKAEMEDVILTPKMGIDNQIETFQPEEIQQSPRTAHEKKPKQFIMIPIPAVPQSGVDQPSTVVKSETSNSNKVMNASDLTTSQLSAFYKKSDCNKKNFSPNQKPFKFQQGEPTSRVTYEEPKNGPPRQQKKLVNQVKDSKKRGQQKHQISASGWEVDRASEETMMKYHEKQQEQEQHTTLPRTAKPAATVLPFKQRQQHEEIGHPTSRQTSLPLSQITSQGGTLEDTATMSVGCGGTKTALDSSTVNDGDVPTLAAPSVNTPLSNTRVKHMQGLPQQVSTPQGVEIYLGEYQVAVGVPKDISGQQMIYMAPLNNQESAKSRDWKSNLDMLLKPKEVTYKPTTVLLNKQSDLSQVNLLKTLKNKGVRQQARQQKSLRNRSNNQSLTNQQTIQLTNKKQKELNFCVNALPIPPQSKDLTVEEMNTVYMLPQYEQLSKGIVSPVYSSPKAVLDYEAGEIYEQANMQLTVPVNHELSKQPVTYIPQTRTTDISQLSQINPLTELYPKIDQQQNGGHKNIQRQKFVPKGITKKLRDKDRSSTMRHQAPSPVNSNRTGGNEDLGTLQIHGCNTAQTMRANQQPQGDDKGPNLPQLLSEEQYMCIENDANNSVHHWASIGDSPSMKMGGNPDIVTYSRMVAERKSSSRLSTKPDMLLIDQQKREASVPHNIGDLDNQIIQPQMMISSRTGLSSADKKAAHIGYVEINISRAEQSHPHSVDKSEDSAGRIQDEVRGSGLHINSIQKNTSPSQITKQKTAELDTQRQKDNYKQLPKRDLPHTARQLKKVMKPLTKNQKESSFTPMVTEDNLETSTIEVNSYQEIINATAHMASSMSVASDKQQILVHNEQEHGITEPTRLNSVRENQVEEKQYLMLDLGVLAEDGGYTQAKKNEVVTPMRVFNKQEHLIENVRRQVLSNKGARDKNVIFQAVSPEASYRQTDQTTDHNILKKVTSEERNNDESGIITRQSFVDSTIRASMSLGCTRMSPHFYTKPRGQIDKQKQSGETKMIGLFNTKAALANKQTLSPTMINPHLAIQTLSTGSTIDKNVGYRSSKINLKQQPFAGRKKSQKQSTALPCLKNNSLCLNNITESNTTINPQQFLFKNQINSVNASGANIHFKAVEEGIAEDPIEELERKLNLQIHLMKSEEELRQDTAVARLTNDTQSSDGRMPTAQNSVELSVPSIPTTFQRQKKRQMIEQIATKMKQGLPHRSPLLRNDHYNPMQGQSKQTNLKNPLYDIMSMTDRHFDYSRTYQLASPTNLGNTGLLTQTNFFKNRQLSVEPSIASPSIVSRGEPNQMPYQQKHRQCQSRRTGGNRAQSLYEPVPIKLSLDVSSPKVNGFHI